jgi:hypothetical protein
MSQVPYFRIAAAAAACWLMQAGTCQAAPQDAAKTIACFNAGNQTVQSMYACSGYWVTSRALMFCLFQSECPVLGDTVADRATLDASLGRDQRNTQLTLDAASLPKFPSASQIEDCNNKEHNAGAFRDCVLNAMAVAPPGLLQCASITDDRVRAGCLIAIANDPEITQAARCIHHIADAQDFLSCLDNPDFARVVRTAASCLNAPDRHPADCLDPEANAADAALIDCVSSSGMTAVLAAKCLDNESPDLSKVHQTTTCLQKPGSEALKCAFILASGATAKVIDCLSNIGKSQARAACVLSSIPDFAALATVQACVEQSLKGARLSDCVAPSLGDDAVKFVTCMSSLVTAKLDKCLSSLPNTAEALRDQACLLKTLGTARLLACVSAKLGGEAPTIVACALGDQGKVLPCLVGARPDYPATKQVYSCVDGGRGAGAVIENCAGGLIKDEKTRRLASCLAESSGDKGRWAACAALAALPADAARYVSCAADNHGATSFALCSLGATMNEEWRIAAACAVQAHGDPSAYAGCTAGLLTVQELANCFGGKVGRDCYGPDDAVVQGLHDALRGVLAAPGKNGFAVVAVNKIGQLAGGPSSVVNNPGQISAGKNSIFHNPGKGLGNDNSIFHNLRQIARIPAPRQSVVYQVTHTKLR